jgi:hypothetical protein
MVNLNKSDILKIHILRQFKKKKIDYTASYMSELLNSKFETANKALEFFFEIGVLEKDVKEHGERNITYYSLTDIGSKLLSSPKI